MFEKQRATQPIRTALIGCYLRQLVDTWLEAGRKPDGSESPASRRLTIPMLLEVEDYLDKYPSFRPNLNDRGIEIEIASPDMVLSERGVIERSWNFFDAQKQSALRLFVGMLASDWKERICKCRDPRCGRYFLIPKARENYLSGTFCCRAHATRTAAARCMQKNRANAKMGLIEEAARYLSDVGAGPGWVTDSRIRLKVVRHLCLVIERRKRLQAYYYNWLKANWVTLHRDAIEQKRLEHVPHRPRVIAARRGR
jgi:hypothetical protein